MKRAIKLLTTFVLMMLVAAPTFAQDFNAGETLSKFVREMGFLQFFSGMGWGNAVMIVIACIFLYLAIVKKYEPLLLLPIAFGMLLSNIPGAGMFHTSMWNDEFLNPNSPFFHSYRHVLAEGGLLDVKFRTNVADSLQLYVSSHLAQYLVDTRDSTAKVRGEEKVGTLGFLKVLPNDSTGVRLGLFFLSIKNRHGGRLDLDTLLFSQPPLHGDSTKTE